MLSDPLRMHLVHLLDWHEAHAGFDKAVTGVPFEFQGTPPPGLPYSPWQLLEHMRIAQHDILEFCRNAEYVEQKWPDDYWPRSSSPTTAHITWDSSCWCAGSWASGPDRERAFQERVARIVGRALSGSPRGPNKVRATCK